jgi:uncharacterized protein (TIGR02647 family)
LRIAKGKSNLNGQKEFIGINMPYHDNVIDELNLLVKFSRRSVQEGLKVHHDADIALVEAAERLHSKGMISQIDGGYLTDRGIETAEKAHALIDALDVKVD